MWLHSIHSELSGLNEGEASSLVIAPIQIKDGDESRKERLRTWLSKVARGEKQLTGFAERLGQPAILGKEGFILKADNGTDLHQIPLLCADVMSCKVTAKVSDDDHQPAYVLAVAPRPKPQGKPPYPEPPLEEVWIFCLRLSEVELSELLFDLSYRGALRWDFTDHYQLSTNALGSGGYGTVYSGVQKSQGRLKGGTPVAVKLLNKEVCKTEQPVIRAEIEFLCRARGHPNITALFGVFCFLEKDSDDSEDNRQDSEESPLAVRWAIVSELCENGDLHDFLTAHGPLAVDACLEMMCGVFSALAHLHHCRIVHRDVKAENILLNGKPQPILADLGIAAYFDDKEQMSKMVGSPGYAAPEIVRGFTYNEKVDVFSTGVVLYFALCGKLPFIADDVNHILRLTARCKIRYNYPVFKTLHGGVLSFLTVILSKEPELRPSARKAFAAAWSTSPPKICELPTMQSALQSLPPKEEVRKQETKQDEPASTSPKRSGSMSRRKLEEQADRPPPQRSGSMPTPRPKIVVINDQADEVCPQRSGSMPTKGRNEDLLASPAVPPEPQSSSSFHSRRPKRHGTKNSNFSAKVDVIAVVAVEDEVKAPEDLPSSVPGRIRRLLGSIAQSSNVRASSKASGTQGRLADQKSDDEEEEQLVTPSPSGSMASTSAFLTWRPRFFRAKTAAAPPSASSAQAPAGSVSAPPGPHYADSDASRVAGNQLTQLVPTPPAEPRRS